MITPSELSQIHVAAARRTERSLNWPGVSVRFQLRREMSGNAHDWSPRSGGAWAMRQKLMTSGTCLSDVAIARIDQY